jgi:hypothetical protein
MAPDTAKVRQSEPSWEGFDVDVSTHRATLGCFGCPRVTAIHAQRTSFSAYPNTFESRWGYT